jgi:hypothetical protein
MSLRFEGNYWSASDNSTGADVIIGTWSSATAGVGKTLNSAKTKALDVCCDDKGAALSATSYRAIRGRMLLTAAQSGDCSPFGIQGHLKNTAADTTTGNKAGVWGYYEAGSAATVAANSAGVYAMIDVPSGATIAGSVGGLQICSNDLGGTHTGKAGCIHMPNPVSGTWDFFAIFGSATGATKAGGAGAATLAGGWVSLPVLVGSTTYYIPCSVTITNT